MQVATDDRKAEEVAAQQQTGLGDTASAGFGSPVSSQAPTGMSCCTFIRPPMQCTSTLHTLVLTSSRAVRLVGASEQRSQASLHPHPSPPPLWDRLLDPGPTLTQRSQCLPRGRGGGG